MIDLEQVAKRLDRREGFKLMSYREVGIPLFRLSSLVTLQETARIGAVEEFTLRCIGIGVNTVDRIAGFLGLPRSAIESEIADLAFEGYITIGEGENEASYALSPEGERRVSSESATQIVREQMPLYLDGITRKLVAVDPRDLWNAKQLEEQGVSVLSPNPRRSPRIGEIEVSQINRVIGLMARLDRPSLRAVRLDALLGKPTLLFRRAAALAFKSEDGRRVSIAFAVDGRESQEHEVEFERSSGAAKSSIFSSLLDSDKRRRQLQLIGREVRQDFEGGFQQADGVIAAKKQVLSRAKSDPIQFSQTARFRTLSVYEHPDLLRQAFESAKRRVLLISPWIRSAVVDEAFIKRLTRCLDRGVSVTIAYGIGKRDPNERDHDRRAREALEALATTFQNFRLVKKGDTHAKVLLVDDAFFITTSFNWLSFKGDPSQPMREEEGTMVTDSAAVDAYFDRLISRIGR